MRLALLATSLVAAVGGGASVIVPKGFDRETHCKACLQFVKNVEELLHPDLEALAAQNAKRFGYGKDLGMGEMDDLAQRHIDSGCKSVSILGVPGLRKSCEHIVDKYGEEMADAVARWAKAGRAKSELRGLMCAKLARACRTTDLSKSLDAKNKTQYRTSKPPERNDEPLYIITGETLHKTINTTGRDLLIYFRYRFEAGQKPYVDFDEVADRGRDHLLRPRVQRIAELLWALPRARRAMNKTLVVAEIDGDTNELPPPYDHIKRATVAVFPSNRSPDDSKMSFVEWLEPEKTLGGILDATMNLVHEVHSQRHIANLMNHLGNERLFSEARAVDWWEDDEVLARARAPYDEEELATPEADSPAKAAEGGRKKRKRRKARRDEL